MAGKVTQTMEQRFWSKVTVPDTWDGCWLWTGAVNGNGYGYLGRPGKNNGHEYAHRYSYMLHKGKIPPELEISHLCNVRNCINPDHLEVSTHRDNSRYSMTRDYCSNGHLRKTMGEGSNCRECNRLRMQWLRDIGAYQGRKYVGR